jgi:hypothetical protein
MKEKEKKKKIEKHKTLNSEKSSNKKQKRWERFVS